MLYIQESLLRRPRSLSGGLSWTMSSSSGNDSSNFVSPRTPLLASVTPIGLSVRTPDPSLDCTLLVLTERIRFVPVPPAPSQGCAVNVHGTKGRLGGSIGEVSDFGSGHDLAVGEFEPRIRLSAVGTEPASDPLSPSLSAPPLPKSK